MQNSSLLIMVQGLNEGFLKVLEGWKLEARNFVGQTPVAPPQQFGYSLPARPGILRVVSLGGGGMSSVESLMIWAIR
jgi:hypothetical protein